MEGRSIFHGDLVVCVCAYVCICGCMDVWVYGCLCVCVFVCMDVVDREGGDGDGDLGGGRWVK